MLTPDEIYLIDRSIQAYKNTIKFLNQQIIVLERKKLNKFLINCPECFKVLKEPNKIEKEE